ncbi:heterokaryon incompatibility protein-domain-containing protein [Annulohypoxylon nitens]|nr:heterokaryon incompatibility protein-domain-containing protein [Annulohypoxylon nitens]
MGRFPLQWSPWSVRERIGPLDLDQPKPYLQLSPAQLYDSLPVGENRTIRLLDLDKLPHRLDTDEEPLSGSLRVVSLTTRPSFTALSYVWGTYSTPHPDVLELRHSGGPNVKLKISTNCRDALRALRRMHGSLCIWVDAICINQNNNAEKETQIRLMEDIYSWATEVYAWLGPSTAASDRVMDWARRVAKHDFLSVASATHPPTQKYRSLYNSIALYRMAIHLSIIIGDTFLAWILLPYTLFKPRGILRLSINGNCYLRVNDTLQFDDMQDILNSQWFQRVWTFQEAVLSPNLILVCGHKHLEWAHIVTAVRMSETCGMGYRLNRSESSILSESPSLVDTTPLPIHDLVNVWMHAKRPMKWEESLKPKEMQYFSYASWLQYSYQDTLRLSITASFYHKGSRNAYFAGILQTIRTREATDERDRSYAAYGVLQRLGIKNLSQPDYSKSLGQVYQDLIRDLLQWNPTTLSLLLDAGVYPQNDYPSWVPHWSTAAKSQWIRSDYILNAAEPLTIATSEVWLEFRGDDRLVVKGIQIGTIGFSSGKFRRICDSEINPPTSGIGAAINKILRWLRHLVKDDIAYLAYRDLSQVVANVLDAEIDSRAGLHLDTRREFYHWYESLIGSRVVLQESIDIEPACQGSDTREFEDNVTEQTSNFHPRGYEAEKLTIEICNHLAGRRGLFAAASGIAGSGPETTKSGDIVMIIQGIPVPMILREVLCDDGETSDDIAYRIIGPAYVYGTLEDNFEEYGEIITLV